MDPIKAMVTELTKMLVKFNELDGDESSLTPLQDDALSEAQVQSDEFLDALAKLEQALNYERG